MDEGRGSLNINLCRPVVVLSLGTYLFYYLSYRLSPSRHGAAHACSGVAYGAVPARTVCRRGACRSLRKPSRRQHLAARISAGAASTLRNAGIRAPMRVGWLAAPPSLHAVSRLSLPVSHALFLCLPAPAPTAMLAYHLRITVCRNVKHPRCTTPHLSPCGARKRVPADKRHRALPICVAARCCSRAWNLT